MAWEVFKGQGTRAHGWTPEEDQRVLAQDVPDAELTKQLDRRTVKAIRIRRSRLRETAR